MEKQLIISIGREFGSGGHEIAEMLGGMGINALESLRGNRDHLRGVGLYEWELDVLGIKGAGE